MSDIAELLERYRAALDAKNIAVRECAEAETALHNARCEATGMLGKTLEVRGRKLLVENLKFISDEGRPYWVEGRYFKKDGTVGSQFGSGLPERGRRCLIYRTPSVCTPRSWLYSA